MEFASAKILVAEDNSTNQMVISAHLAALGFTYKVAQNGIEVLKALSEDKYDLILMDCLMPEMDGFEATRQIRQHEQQSNNPRLPIVALTGNVSEEDQQKIKDCGMDAFIGKPVKRDILINSLQLFLKTK